ncbi:patatin-like phospholipase family protein [Paenibacillus shirakamiensis]|uniref:patatin-like phospholipase family protein n=1 Tax=Paenibacillus shirakamiensis TaxID=1265935 RepID=UPI001AE3BB86|nr:patatin-like phospholipase family protein [Paenibacillus shirakamiensis]
MRINGVFQGGGVRGISLVGAVQAAEQHAVQFERVAGTSSGSIVASLIAAGYNAQEMKNIIMDTSFTKFLKRASIFNISLIGPALRILLKKGLYSGEALEDWLRGVLKTKGIQTFKDLPSGKLTIIASDITSGKILVLPDDLDKLGIKSADFDVAHAVRMSCSIPYFFDPVLLRLPPKMVVGRPFAEQFDHIVDGALLSNLPLWLFDQEGTRTDGGLIPTVGFQMVGKNSNQPHNIKGPFSMLQALVETMLSAHDERYIEQENRYRTIKVPILGVSPTEFNITHEESLLLYESGLRAGTKFFSDWSSQRYEEEFIKYFQQAF